MSTPGRNTAHTELEIIPNKKEETVTFVADYERDSIVPSTEWITVGTDDTIDLRDNR